MAYDGGPSWEKGAEGKGLLDGVKRRDASYAATGAAWFHDWREVERYSSPRVSKWLGTKWGGTPADTSGRGSGGAMNNKLVDGRLVKAHGILTNGIDGSMSSPAQQWFSLATEDDELMQYQPVKEWLDIAKDRIYKVLAKTNFYTSSKIGYGENARYGTEVVLIFEHWLHGITTIPLRAGEYWLGMDDTGFVNTVYRRLVLDTYAMCTKFGLENLPSRIQDAYRNNRYSELHEVRHSIEPDDKRFGGGLTMHGKTYRSVYWMPNEDHPLQVEGFTSRPFYVCRWDQEGFDPYGTSPCMYALADTKGLQLQVLRLHQAIDYMVKPALRGPATLAHTYANLMPGGITTMSMMDNDQFTPIWQIDPNGINAIRETVVESRRDVNEWCYADLMMSITNMPGVQPRNMEEIARRNEEKLTQLGPATNRVNTEKLGPAVDAVFQILLRKGGLPPAPQELQDQEVSVEFISLMTQLQRQAGVGVIERYLSFAGSLLAAYPDSHHKTDANDALDEYARRLGVPARMTRSQDQIDAIMQGEAQVAAQQQQAEQMAAMAPAAKDIAAAAQIMSQTDGGTGGGTMLDNLRGIAV